MKVRKERLILFLVVVLGLILRIWGIDFGLPFLFHQDEPIVVNHALAYGSGDLNPHFFKIPPLTSYILFFIYGVYYLLGSLLGFFQTPESFALTFFRDPTTFYLLGRFFIGVIPGILCVVFTYILYRRLFTSEKAATFAAAVVSFSFLNVLSSHYIYTDMLVLLFIILGILQMADILDRPTLKNYLLAGIWIGVACGIKYNTAILMVTFFVTHLVLYKDQRAKLISRNFTAAIISSAIAFFLVNPFALIDFRSFIDELLTQGGSESYIGWVHHIGYSLRECISTPFLALGLVGLVFLCITKSRKAIFLLSFPLAFYLHLVFFSQHFPRYAIPLVPFLAIGAGYFVFEYLIPGIEKGWVRKAVVTMAFLIFIPLITKSVKADLLLASTDTRIEAADWIKDNLDPKEDIAVDHTFFRPAIIQNKQQLIDKYKITYRQKGLTEIKDRKLQLMLKAQEDKQGYYIYFLNPRPEQQGEFLATVPALPFDYEILKGKGIDYVVINYANRQKDREDFYKSLKEKGILLVSFSPYQDDRIRFSYDTIATTCMPVSSKELYSRKKSGPALEIYKIEKDKG